ncbi:MAG TPA: hypothetical protein VFT27_04240 [Actinomycetota bacterium]|nr:hypothetical protein [Actinomycetota bacterium]
MRKEILGGVLVVLFSAAAVATWGRIEPATQTAAPVRTATTVVADARWTPKWATASVRGPVGADIEDTRQMAKQHLGEATAQS